MHMHIIYVLLWIYLLVHTALAVTTDIPKQCYSICDPVDHVTEECSTKHSQEQSQLKCICNCTDMSTILPLCEACIIQNNGSTDGGNDAGYLLTQCHFSSTTYDPAAASSALESSTSSPKTTTTATGSATGSATTTTPSAASSNVPGYAGFFGFITWSILVIFVNSM